MFRGITPEAPPEVEAQSSKEESPLTKPVVKTIVKPIPIRPVVAQEPEEFSILPPGIEEMDPSQRKAAAEQHFASPEFLQNIVKSPENLEKAKELAMTIKSKPLFAAIAKAEEIMQQNPKNVVPLRKFGT